MQKFSAGTHLPLQTRLKAIFAFLAILTILPFSTVLAATYTTIKNGAWDDDTIWKGGKSPGNPINNSDNIFVEHSVTIGAMLVNNGATITIVAPSGNLSGSSISFNGNGNNNDGKIIIESGTSVKFGNTTTTGPATITPSPLPVSWLYFKGKASDKGNELNWATATEKNALAFEVERSVNGKSFEQIGTVKAAGNSNQVLTYSFTDKQPVAGVTTYYRLKQTDFDGKYEYSSIIAVRNNQPVQLAIYPNLVADFMEIQLPKAFTAEQTLEILNIKGTVVKKISAGTTNIINVEDLTSGIYFIKVAGAADYSQTRFVKL